MSSSSADQALVRELNLSLVLRLIHNEPSVSRAKIAHFTGLNKSTVSSLVDFLIDRKLIHETGINSVGTGRPARLLEINPYAGSVIGAEFGVDFVAVAVTDFTGNILWRKKDSAHPADRQEETLAKVLDLIKQAIVVCNEKELNILGLGIATPGTVNLEDGVLIFAPNLQWRNVPLRAYFSKHTGLKVFIENDANSAALGEHLFGNAKTSLDFIFVFAGIGIGGGLFLNGHLYRGDMGYAGEIGHSPIMAEPFQSPCHCGNRGCWETYANQHSIIRRVQARLDARRSSMVSTLMEEQEAPLSITIIKQAADAGDKEVLEALSETGSAMGLGLATLLNMFNPEKIFLGGPLSIVGNYLLPAIKESAIIHALPEMRPNIEILLSSFEQDASLIGAISIVVDDILSKPTQIERR